MLVLATYDEARKKLSVAEYTSDLDTGSTKPSRSSSLTNLLPVPPQPNLISVSQMLEKGMASSAAGGIDPVNIGTTTPTLNRVSEHAQAHPMDVQDEPFVIQDLSQIGSGVCSLECTGIDNFVFLANQI